MNRPRFAIGWGLAAIAWGGRRVALVRSGRRRCRAQRPIARGAQRGLSRARQRIAFWERAVAEHHRGDMMSPATLSSEYLQRYRERGDIGDVVRALHGAWMSLRAQPYGNVSARSTSPQRS